MGRYKQPFSLYKRGRFYYYRTYRPDGVRTSGVSTACTTKTAAYNFCNKLYLEGKLWTSEMTFTRFAQDFLNDDSPYVRDRSKPLTPRTLHLYRNCLNLYLLPDVGDVKLNDINYTFLKKLRASYLERGLSSSYVISIFSIFKKIILAAYRDDIIQKNPFEALEGISIKTKTHDAFTREEVKKLLNFFDPHYQKVIIFLALTGLRISEAMALSLDDVVEDNNILYVKIKKQLLKDKLEDLKTPCSIRDIPIIPEVARYFKDRDFSLPYFYRKMKECTKTIDPTGERNLSIHSLRHFFITDSKACGIDDKKVEVLAGHKIRGIEGVYTNFKVSNLIDILGWQKEIFDFIK